MVDGVCDATVPTVMSTVSYLIAASSDSDY